MGAFDDLTEVKKSVFDDLPDRKEGPSSGGVLSNPVLNPALRFAVGAGRGLAGTGQFVTNLATQGTFPESQAFINRNVWDPLFRSFGRAGQILNPEGKMDIAGFGGEVLSPANLKLAKAMGPVNSIWQRIAQGSIFGASSAATQPVAPGKDYQSEKRDQLAIGAVAGGAIPIATEAVKFIGRPAIELIKYFAPGGTERLTTKWFNKIVGPDNIKEIVSDLESQMQSKAPTNVPGYQPTTGELISRIPESSPLLAVQNRVSGIPGGLSGMFARRAAENRAAIEGALAPIAGTEADLNAAINLASNRAAQNYGPIMQRTVSPESDAALLLRDLQATRGIPQWQPSQGSGPFTGKAGALQQWGKAATDEATQTSLANKWTPVQGMPRVSGRYSANAEVADQARKAAQDALEIAGVRGKEADFIQVMLDRLERYGIGAKQGLDTMVSRPSMANAIAYAQKMAAERGYRFPASVADDFSIQNLHDIKLGLDAQIRAGAAKNLPTSLDNATLASIANTKDAFLAWMKTKSPEYDAARRQFAQDMIPVNRMQVGQALQDRLLSPTGTMTPGSYLRAINDETRLVKNAIGQPRSSLGQVFNPTEQATVSEIGNLLERQLAVKNPAVKTTLGTGAIEDIAKISLPSLLSRPIVFANWILRSVTGGTSSLEKGVERVAAMRMLYPEQFLEAMNSMPKGKAAEVMSLLERNGVANQGTLAINPAVRGLLDNRD